MTSLRLLVVEDHLNCNAVLCSLLKKRGHRVTGVLTAREALDAARTQRFDLVIMDIGLPDDNGWNLVLKLRRFVPGLPAIAFTASGTEADRKRSEIVGFAAHLLKPVDIDTLESAIARAVSSPNAEDTPSTSAPPG